MSKPNRLQKATYEVNMNDLKKDELEQFKKKHETELGELKRNLEKAKGEYEKAMKRFVIKHITSTANFKSRFRDALRDTLDRVVEYPIWDVVGDSGVDILVYENMIDDEMYWLEEGRYQVEDERDEKV